jgi:hypothetical protein
MQLAIFVCEPVQDEKCTGKNSALSAPGSPRQAAWLKAESNLGRPFHLEKPAVGAILSRTCGTESSLLPQEEFTMPNETQTPKPINPQDVKESEIPVQKKVQHIADEAAKKAAKTENKYDKENSNLFTK